MKYLSLWFILFAFNASVFGHAGHGHDKALVAKLKSSGNPRFAEINKSYLEKVRPIFEKKCFDCHSDKTRYPWYYRVPGFHQYMSGDVEEGREHIDMSGDFPFRGHGTPREDLVAIAKVASEQTMPPTCYCLLHKARLTSAETSAIVEWANNGIRTLDNSNERPMGLKFTR